MRLEWRGPADGIAAIPYGLYAEIDYRLPLRIVYTDPYDEVHYVQRDRGRLPRALFGSGSRAA